jgi:hypothetical protein
MYIIPGGFGTAVSQSTTFIQLTAGIKAEDIAVAGTSLYLSQNMRTAAGPSPMIMVLQSGLRPALAKGLRGVPHKQNVTLLSNWCPERPEIDQLRRVGKSRGPHRVSNTSSLCRET